LTIVVNVREKGRDRLRERRRKRGLVERKCAGNNKVLNFTLVGESLPISNGRDLLK
jgi:hypothetical protein